MRYKLVLVQKSELQKGERDEAGEHFMPPDEAETTAAQHLEKHPWYYTDLEKAGLGEAIDTGKEFPYSDKKATGGRLKRLKQYKKPFTVVGGSNIAGGQH